LPKDGLVSISKMIYRWRSSDFFVYTLKDRVQQSIFFYLTLIVSFHCIRVFGFSNSGYLRKISYLIVRFFPLSSSYCDVARWLVSQPVPKIKSRDSFCFHYSIIIKPYVSGSEKGILLVSFEKQLDKLNSHPEIRKILDRYFVIFVPSTSGYISDALLRFRCLNVDGFATFPVHRYERTLSDSLFNGKVFALKYNAASWVNFSNFYSKKRSERYIDCLLVANYGVAKRHRVMFGILRKLPPNVRLVCVGLPVDGRDKSTLLAEAQRYGVESRIEIIENPTQEVLREVVASAKVFCAVSYIEGSYIGVAEALASGTPVIMFKNSIVGTKNLINNNNGYLANDINDYRKAILRVIGGVDNDDIRRHSAEVVDAWKNSERLNQDLRNIFVNLGQEWTCDIEKFYTQKLTSRYFFKESEKKVRRRLCLF